MKRETRKNAETLTLKFMVKRSVHPATFHYLSGLNKKEKAEWLRMTAERALTQGHAATPEAMSPTASDLSSGNMDFRPEMAKLLQFGHTR